MKYKHKELDFKSLRKSETDFDKLKKQCYFNLLVRISRTDDDKEGSNYYTLFDGREIVAEHYIIIHSWSRGWDQYGVEYVCNREELRKFIKDNEDNNNPFINAIKSYLGQEDGVTYHKYNEPKFNYIKRRE